MPLKKTRMVTFIALQNDFVHNALHDLQPASKMLNNSKFKMKSGADNWFMKSFVLN